MKAKPGLSTIGKIILKYFLQVDNPDFYIFKALVKIMHIFMLKNNNKIILYKIVVYLVLQLLNCRLSLLKVSDWSVICILVCDWSNYKYFTPIGCLN